MAGGKLDSDIAAEIVGGIAAACKETGTALIGGETAEMPGMYQVGDYDVAGFCVGVVEKDEIIDGSEIREGQMIIGLPSSGFHSNGFSLVRKIIHDFNEEFEGKPVWETLLVPTKLYQNDIFKIREKVQLSGIAHITGGGLIENVPRILPKGLTAVIKKSKVKVPTVMQELMKRGGIAEDEMFGTFNMGVGMVGVCDAKDADTILNLIEGSMAIGEIQKGEEEIILK